MSSSGGGQSKHDQILPDRVAEVVRRVKDGKLGFIGIHSGKDSKIFQTLLNDTGRLGEWRHDAGPKTLKVGAPFHPIARGIRDFTIPETEMYNEPFGVLLPDSVIFFSYWKTEEQFRNGWSGNRRPAGRATNETPKIRKVESRYAMVTTRRVVLRPLPRTG